MKENPVKEIFALINYAPLFKTMKERKISSYRLEKMGFSRATYYSIQKGNSVSTNTINQLCKLLKCDVSDVMQYIDEEE
jgi:putative transcriptional regulator